MEDRVRDRAAAGCSLLSDHSQASHKSKEEVSENGQIHTNTAQNTVKYKWRVRVWPPDMHNSHTHAHSHCDSYGTNNFILPCCVSATNAFRCDGADTHMHTHLFHIHTNKKLPTYPFCLGQFCAKRGGGNPCTVVEREHMKKGSNSLKTRRFRWS